MEFVIDESWSADYVSEMLRNHMAAVRQLRLLLPRACERDGHQWDNPAGQTITVYSERLAYPEDDRPWSVKPRIDGYNQTQLYVRKCKRCGHEERREPLRVSPWWPVNG